MYYNFHAVKTKKIQELKAGYSIKLLDRSDPSVIILSVNGTSRAIDREQFRKLSVEELAGII